MKVIMLGGNTKEEIEKRLQIVASAGNLSRSEGTVTEVIESHNDYETNLKLAKLVIGLGHTSIEEHDYLVFALEDVTPIVEQTIIGYRLTSFTIKSRRNVDFRNVGFYVPEFKDKNGNVISDNSELQAIYKEHMQSLFNKYGDLVDENLPIEDCRYILPYSYHSNIIMGCDVHELFNMVGDMLYGNISKIDEIRDLGEKLKDLIEEYVPYLKVALKKEKDKYYYGDKLAFLDSYSTNITSKHKVLDRVHLLDYTEDGDYKVVVRAIMARYHIDYQEACDLIDTVSASNPSIKKEIIDAIARSKQQRELESVYYTFEIPISLAVLTHLTRHRMHSLIVPDFTTFDLKNYVTPISFVEARRDQYDEILEENRKLKREFEERGVREEDLIYFLLSGNSCNVTTTINARALEWVSRMRCCNKAQWEIRGLVNQMVEEASSVTPLIGEEYGASCKVLGFCPEGKDSCKNRGVVKMGKNV